MVGTVSECFFFLLNKCPSLAGADFYFSYSSGQNFNPFYMNEQDFHFVALAGTLIGK